MSVINNPLKKRKLKINHLHKLFTNVDKYSLVINSFKEETKTVHYWFKNYQDFIANLFGLLKTRFYVKICDNSKFSFH